LTLPFPRMSKVATQRVETGGAPRCSHPGGPPRRAQRRPRVERKPSLKFLGTDDQRMARTGANRARTVFLCVVSLSLSLFLVCTYLRTFSLWEKRERDARFLSCVFDRPTPSCYVSYFRFLCTQICLLAFVRRQREAVSTSPCPGKTSVKPGPWLAWARGAQVRGEGDPRQARGNGALLHQNRQLLHHQITAIGTKSQEELRPPSSSRWKNMFFSIFCLGSNALVALRTLST